MQYTIIAAITAINLVLFVFLICYNRKIIAGFLRTIGKRARIILFCIFCGAVIIRLTIPYKHHALPYDGVYYIRAALDTFQGYIRPMGWPFVLALIFKIFPPSNAAVFNTSVLFGSLTAVNVFLLARALFKNNIVPLFSAFIFALLPYHIFWSATGETDTASLFFSTLAVLLSILYFQNERRPLLWLSIIALALAAQFRPENAGLLLVFLIVGAINFRGEIYRWVKRLTAPLALYALLVIPGSLNVIGYYRWFLQNGGYPPRSWAVADLIHDFVGFAGSLFDGSLLPASWLLLALLGLTCVFIYHKNIFIVLSVWFLYMLLFYFIFYPDTPLIINGQYPLYLTARAYFNVYPVTAIFISCGIYFILYIPFRHFLRSHVLLSGFLSALFCLFIFAAATPYYASLRSQVSGSQRLIAEVMDTAHESIPRDCTVVAPIPEVFAFAPEIKTVGVRDFLDNEDDFAHTDCLLFLEDYFCHGRRIDDIVACQRVKSEYQTAPQEIYTLGNTQAILHKLSLEKSKKQH